MCRSRSDPLRFCDHSDGVRRICPRFQLRDVLDDVIGTRVEVITEPEAICDTVEAWTRSGIGYVVYSVRS